MQSCIQKDPISRNVASDHCGRETNRVWNIKEKPWLGLPFTFNVTKEIKTIMLKYKIIHGILPTNSLLCKIKKVPILPCRYPYHPYYLNLCELALSGLISKTGLVTTVLSSLDVVWYISLFFLLFSPETTYYRKVLSR